MNGTYSHDQDDGGPRNSPGHSAHTPSTPTQLLCPACEQPLVYQQAVTRRIDGREGFACQNCGGFFIYQDRTPHQRRAPDAPETDQRLRRVSETRTR
jgi:RNase P subunit RPR2